MGKCDADSGVLFSACLPVSQSRLSGQMPDSPACLPVSPSLCGQMSDAVTPLRGRVARLSPCVSQSPRSDARCCDAGSGLVSRLSVSDAGSRVVCLPVSPRCCDATPGSCLPLVSLCVVSLL